MGQCRSQYLPLRLRVWREVHKNNGITGQCKSTIGGHLAKAWGGKLPRITTVYTESHGGGARPEVCGEGRGGKRPRAELLGQQGPEAGAAQRGPEESRPCVTGAWSARPSRRKGVQRRRQSSPRARTLSPKGPQRSPKPGPGRRCHSWSGPAGTALPHCRPLTSSSVAPVFPLGSCRRWCHCGHSSSYLQVDTRVCWGVTHPGQELLSQSTHMFHFNKVPKVSKMTVSISTVSRRLPLLRVPDDPRQCTSISLWSLWWTCRGLGPPGTDCWGERLFPRPLCGVLGPVSFPVPVALLLTCEGSS